MSREPLRIRLKRYWHTWFYGAGGPHLWVTNQRLARELQCAAPHHHVWTPVADDGWFVGCSCGEQAVRTDLMR